MTSGQEQGEVLQPPGNDPAAPSGAASAGTRRFRPVTGAAAAATILILLTLAREVLVSASNWHGYLVVHDYLAGKATDADLDAVDSDVFAVLAGSWPMLLVRIPAGVAFLVWLWRARVNAELVSGAAAHRRSRGWAVGGWFVPVANLWIPYQVVADVWRASSPRWPATVAPVTAWWALLLASTVVRPFQWAAASHLTNEKDVLTNANMSTLLTALYLVSGALIILIMRRVTAWQTHGPVPNAV